MYTALWNAGLIVYLHLHSILNIHCTLTVSLAVKKAELESAVISIEWRGKHTISSSK